ncbi:endonuclease/exonuclease/phosphatase family protein [Streptomyces sp. NPDC008150]|uniref:endonuclease/exonuclease/phosphatase family protein n=1 Tax=Streptomyces sp. NPDC008150 TaxID=3364816 RepID=UPI0036EC31C1
MPIHRPSATRVASAAFVAATATAAVIVAPLPAAFAAPSASAVISEAYGGGGNSGATLTNDFVELANRSASAYSLDGYSLQYLPAAASASSLWQVTPLTGSVAPGGDYLIGEGAGAGGTDALPTVDASGSIAMAAASGTVALVKGSTALTCKTVADCTGDANVVDLLGYGAAVVREGNAAPAATNTTSVARSATGADTDDNAADFTAGAPTPTNSAGQTTGGGTGGGPTGPTAPGPLRIHDIQGDTRVSPVNGQSVVGVPGIVTAVRTTGSVGYWIQDPTPDADPATSEGLFVYTGSTAPTVSVGDSVLVSGKISEYYPGTGTQSVTELSGPLSTTLSTGNALPASVVLDDTTIPDTYTPTADGGSIDPLPLEPTVYSQDFYESIEGMRASVTDARVVGATNTYGEMFVTAKPDENPTKRGGTLYSGYDQQNTGRIEIVSADGSTPTLNVGDELSGTTTGPVDYASFGGYLLAPTAATTGTAVDNGLKPEVTRKQKSDELALATYNVENLDPTDGADKFTRLAQGVVTNLASPDIVTLEEIQDDNGATDDGTVGAEATLTKFTDAIVAAGGPRYSWRYVNPVNDEDGGEPGGNIRQVFLFNPKRVSFVDRASTGDPSTTAVSVVKDKKKQTHLSASPGRIDPSNAAWADSRKPLAGEFVFQGKTVFVIANHFISKGGDDPIHGRFQEPTRSSETQRKLQAEDENAFVDQLLKSDPKAQIVALGDLNDFEFSDAVKTLTDNGDVLTDLINTLPANERYSYVYDGNSQTLDHILTSPSVTDYNYDVVHINSEFADQTSDHDPQVVRIDVNDCGKKAYKPKPHKPSKPAKPSKSGNKK